MTQIPGHGYLYDVGPGRHGSCCLTNVDSRIGIRDLAPYGATEEARSGLAGCVAPRVSDLSNDGSDLLFLELSSGEGRNPATYLRHSDGSPAVLLGYGTRAVLSPDRKWVACWSGATAIVRDLCCCQPEQGKKKSYPLAQFRPKRLNGSRMASACSSAATNPIRPSLILCARSRMVRVLAP